ncbi:hypothetical protein N658DRAFT_527387 [Parathielavia hyrcaniae]|uniref:Uncharacterized protein n=1 Tax=Parathielavia hyrcaniae TaxID=113614 RepID=A0AAN6PUQ0_9PEZI|nr:hypothetical protein N658DRAFT_527387 [Parathielavia hyrcaniae]
MATQPLEGDEVPTQPTGGDGEVHMAGEGGAEGKNDPPASAEVPMLQIYRKINELFGNGKQDIFQMEFQARLLSQGNYEYVGSDTINAQQVKPPAVAEAEFRLADDMYDISNLVGGANGRKLSDQYREVLFSLVPTNVANRSENDKLLKADQERICAWLEEEVDNFDPPVTDMLDGLPTELKKRLKSAPPPKYEGGKEGLGALGKHDSSKSPKIPRIDLYQKLLDVYESERYRWVKFKNDNRPTDFSKQDHVEHMTVRSLLRDTGAT